MYFCCWSLVFISTVFLATNLVEAQTPLPKRPADPCSRADPCGSPSLVCHRRLCICSDDHFVNKTAVINQCDPSHLPGTHCDKFIYDSRQCVENAFCNPRGQKCECYPGFQSNGTACNLHLPPLSACSTRETKPCVEDAHCGRIGHEHVCLCDDGFYANGGHCNKSLTPGNHCDKLNHDSKQCVENAFCNPHGQKCDCYPDFQSNGTACNLHLSPHSVCLPRDPHPCVENASCTLSGHEHVCLCDSGFYTNGSHCSKTLAADSDCDKKNTDPSQCAKNSACVTDRQSRKATCACVEGYFLNGSDCSPQLKAGDPCNSTIANQCMTTTTCTVNPDSGTEECTCDSDHFNVSGVCSSRVLVNSPCKPQIQHKKQCVDNATCGTLAMCLCDDQYYDYKGHCKERIGADSHCDYGYTESARIEQCTGNASCDGKSSECKCDDGFFSNNTVCSRKLAIGDHCDSSVQSPNDQCVENAECSALNQSCTCMADYYRADSFSCKKRLAPSLACNTVPTADPNQCVTNAYCDKSIQTCVCKPGYFSKGDQCEVRIPVGQSCDSHYHDRYQCPDHADCIGTTCQCHQGFFSDNGNCTRRVDLGKRCNSSLTNGEQCVDNAECVNNTCVCGANAHKIIGLCRLRIAAGSICSVSNTDPHQCVENSVCNGTDPVDQKIKICRCTENFYHRDGQCKPRVNLGQTCTYQFRDRYQCVSNAHCAVNNTCVCDTGYFQDGRVCTSRIKRGDTCNQTNHDPLQCVDGAECETNTNTSQCHCKHDFYYDTSSGTCSKRIPAGTECTTTNECVHNATCRGDGTTSSFQICQCDAGFYDKGGNCARTLLAEEPCLPFITDPSQCVQGALCQKKSGSVPAYQCACDSTDFFQDNAKCYDRVPPGGSCNTSISAVDQCTDNAECNKTRQICLCKKGFYNNTGSCEEHLRLGSTCSLSVSDPMQCGDFAACQHDSRCGCNHGYYNKNGLCVLRVILGDYCDLTVTAKKQCDDDNANCVNDTTGGARCVCKPTHFQPSGQSVCIQSVGTVSPPGTSSNGTPTTASASSPGSMATVHPTPTTATGSTADLTSTFGNGTNTPTAPSSLANGPSDTENDPAATSSDTHTIKSYASIVGGSAAGVVVIVVVAVIMVLFLRRRSLRQRSEPTDGTSEISLVSRCPSEGGNTRVPMLQFHRYLTSLHSASDRLLVQQFQRLKTSSRIGLTTHIGNLPSNQPKNRYSSVLPYDHTRVELFRGNSARSKDYINASFIEGLSSTDEYIATQAPLPTTMADFWKMVFEQSSGVIVMLADPVENRRTKVDEYWPEDLNQPQRYSDVTVEVTSCRDLDSCVIRSITVSMVLHEPLHVTHIHMPGWWKEELAIVPEELLDVVSVVRQAAPSSEGPITVHCSSGVGRTGVFIAVDILARYVEEHSVHDDVDVFSLCHILLTCRPNIIQSEEQYAFIHDAVQVLVDRKMSLMRASSSAGRLPLAYQTYRAPNELGGFMNPTFAVSSEIYAKPFINLT